MTDEAAENHELEQVPLQEEAESASAAAAPVEDPQERNWKEVRQQLKQLKLEKDAIERQLAQQSEAQKPKRSLRDDYNVNDDDLLDAKTAARMTEQIIERRMAEMQGRNSSDLAELRLRAKFQDIDEVVTPDALEALRQEEPELHASIMNQSDMYTKGAAAYKLIKSMAKSKLDPYARERAKAEANLKKPAHSASLKGSASGQQDNTFVNGLDKSTKEKLYKEMRDAMKNINN
jgi:hypothetical protein